MNQLILNPNNLMELRRKSSIADELAFTKSAAWAWLEHRSVVVSDEQTTPEVDVFRSEFNPKPSRYKVEAMNPPPSKPKITNYTLLDRYDIERISRQLEFYIKSNGCRRTGGRRAEAVAVPMDTKRKLPAAPQKKKMSKGITRVPMVCGSSMDEVVVLVDDYTTRRRRSECGHVAVVDLGCRPRHGVRA